jgi:histidyl-tRNA synthetase
MDRLPGFRDFYPDPLPARDLWSADVRTYVFEQWRTVARRYGFREYDGPPLESLDLYTTKVEKRIVANSITSLTKASARWPSAGNDSTLARMMAAPQGATTKSR